MMDSTVSWTQAMAFDAAADGHHIPLDASAEHGGADLGPRPKTLVLTALAGCTAMDVIAILTKMRITPEAFTVTAEGEARDEHPKVFTDIVLTYRFRGDSLPEAKLRRAIQLSEERYCPVSAMLGATVRITHRIEVNGEVLAAAP